MKSETAIFGAGCFWHVELEFSKLPGVTKTEVDQKKITYKKLLEKFWEIHDPSQLNRQGFDIGKQYRSVIFCTTEKQKKEAEESLKEMQKKIKKKIVTKIEKAGKFYKAEEYHQKYLIKKGRNTC